MQIVRALLDFDKSTTTFRLEQTLSSFPVLPELAPGLNAVSDKFF